MSRDYVGEADAIRRRIRLSLVNIRSPRDFERVVGPDVDRLVGIVAACAPSARDGEPVFLTFCRANPDATAHLTDPDGHYLIACPARQLVEDT